MATAPEYRYAMVNRPPWIGMLPRDMSFETQDRPGVGQPHYDMARWGILVITDRALTMKEAASLELAPLVDGGPVLDDLAKRLCDARLGDYPGEYIDVFNAGPDQFASEVLWMVQCLDNGVRYSIADPEELVRLVVRHLNALVAEMAPST